MKNETPCGPAYRFEAREIAAQVLGKFGQNWTAEQVRDGKQPKRWEVQVAMMALMVARGEYALPGPL